MTLEDLYRLLRTGHVQAQGIVDTLGEPLVLLDQSYCVVNANPAFFSTFLIERDEAMGENFFALGSGQWDIPELRRLLGEVIPRSAAVVGYEISANFPSLGPRSIILSARRLVLPDHNSSHMLLLFEDVTERRRVEDEKDIVLAETEHRMKNLVAVVRALARQTQAAGRSGEEYRDAFLGRLEAMVNAQELTRSNLADVDLAGLVEHALEPFAEQARVAPGPTVRLAAAQVLPMRMIMHELCTNAMKYGALSVPDGVIHVSWDVVADGNRNMLRLDWREEHGPHVTPPKYSGFGTRLIDYSAKSDLGGTAELNYQSQGLQVSLLVPLR